MVVNGNRKNCFGAWENGLVVYIRRFCYLYRSNIPVVFQVQVPSNWAPYSFWPKAIG